MGYDIHAYMNSGRRRTVDVSALVLLISLHTFTIHVSFFREYLLSCMNHSIGINEMVRFRLKLVYQLACEEHENYRERV